MRPTLIGHDKGQQPFYLSAQESMTHKHVVGASGTGKSKHLEFEARELLRRGDGFSLIDPHGSLYDAIVEYCSRHVIEREIILLNLSRPDFVIGFNPFQRSPEGDISVQVDRRISATMHAWGVKNTDQTPTLARMLRLVYTVMLELNLSLPQIQYLIDFNAHAVRESLIARLRSSLIQSEWRELQRLQAKEWRDETLSAKNRLFKFLGSETLCRFMGIPGRSIDLRKIVDSGAVLLVRLAPSDYLSHDNAAAFGALLVNEFFEQAGRREPDEFGNPPRPHRLIIDEFGSFVSVDIARMLDEIRKRSLYLTLSHQRIPQLDEDVLDAVLTNCRVKVVFGGLPSRSARLMAEELFLSQVDPKKVKRAISQTKFWPKYTRDKVYSRGSSHTSTSASTRSSGQGRFSGQFVSHAHLPASLGEFGDAIGTSEGTSSGVSELSSISDSSGDAFGQTQSEADIPILLPVPFKEISSIEHYTPEEQLIAFAAALKEQPQRHCFVKVGNHAPKQLAIPTIIPTSDLLT